MTTTRRSEPAPATGCGAGRTLLAGSGVSQIPSSGSGWGDGAPPAEGGAGGAGRCSAAGEGGGGGTRRRLGRGGGGLVRAPRSLSRIDRAVDLLLQRRAGRPRNRGRG